MLVLQTICGNKEASAICWENCLLPVGLLGFRGHSWEGWAVPPILTGLPRDIRPGLGWLGAMSISTHSSSICLLGTHLLDTHFVPGAGDQEMKKTPSLSVWGSTGQDWLRVCNGVMAAA